MRAGLAIAASPCCSPAARARSTSTARCQRPGGRRVSSRSRSMHGTLLVGTPQGVYRSTDGGRTWHTTTRHVWKALSAGFTQASTIVSRGRLLERGNLAYDHIDAPKRSPFHGGSVLALSWLPSGKLYALVHGTYWRLYVTLDSARTWYPRPALDLPISARSIAAARAKGAPDVVYAARGAPGSGARSTRASAGRASPSPRMPSRSPPRRRAGSTSSPRCPSCRGRTTTGRRGTRAARARRSSPRIRATTASGTRSLRTESCSSPRTAAAAGRAG